MPRACVQGGSYFSRWRCWNTGLFTEKIDALRQAVRSVHVALYSLQRAAVVTNPGNRRSAVGANVHRIVGRAQDGLASRLGLVEPDMIARLLKRGVAKLLLFRPHQIHHLTLCVRSSHLKSGPIWP